MDNTSYHTGMHDDCPNLNCKIGQLKNFYKENNLKVTPKYTKNKRGIFI